MHCADHSTLLSQNFPSIHGKLARIFSLARNIPADRSQIIAKSRSFPGMMPRRAETIQALRYPYIWTPKGAVRIHLHTPGAAWAH